jgi:lipoyl-dependent peroxiredoxin
MKQTASAIWVGGFKGGKCIVTTKSGAFSKGQSFAADKSQGRGTSPYELIAAAHAACFSMALAKEFADAGLLTRCINTTAIVDLEQRPEGWTVTGIQLDVLAETPRVKQGDFIEAAVRAKTNCPISRLLKTNISMSAKLDNSEKRPPPKTGRPLDSLKVSKSKKQSIGRSFRKA